MEKLIRAEISWFSFTEQSVRDQLLLIYFHCTKYKVSAMCISNNIRYKVSVYLFYQLSIVQHLYFTHVILFFIDQYYAQHQIDKYIYNILYDESMYNLYLLITSSS